MLQGDARRALYAVALLLVLLGSAVGPASAHSTITLNDPAPQMGGAFGMSVAATGATSLGSGRGHPGNTSGAAGELVGAPYEMADGQPGGGNAYTFFPKVDRLGVTLTSANPQAGGWFGFSVARSDTLAVVGAPHENSEGSSQAGNVYVFKPTHGALVETLKSPNPVSDGWFGYAVGTEANYVIVGAPQEDGGGVGRSGMAYVFNASTGALVSSFVSPEAQPGGFFGGAVALNEEGFLVGAPNESAGGQSGAGRAYSFDLKGSLIDALQSPNPQASGSFGTSVSLRSEDAAVGAPREEAGGKPGAGNAYVFETETGALLGSLSSPNPQGGGWFGYSVVLTPNIVAVGAPHEVSRGVSDVGNAYVFNVTSMTFLATLSNPAPQGQAYLGVAVAAIGNAVVVGAAGETSGGIQGAGIAYIFPKSYLK